MRKLQKLASAAALSVAALTPSVVIAQQPSDQWQFRAVLYGWFPEINGSTTFPAGSGSRVNGPFRECWSRPSQSFADHLSQLPERAERTRASMRVVRPPE